MPKNIQEAPCPSPLIEFLKQSKVKKSNLPRYFYRVFHSGSYNQYDAASGILAGDPAVYLKTDEQAHESLKDHINAANCDRPTPFISVYSDREQAVKLVKKLQSEGKEKIQIAIVYVKNMQDSELWRILDMKLALKYFGMEMDTEAAASAAESEHLFVRHIPLRAMKYRPLTDERFLERTRTEGKGEFTPKSSACQSD